jgi:hypothetical protein
MVGVYLGWVVGSCDKMCLKHKGKCDVVSHGKNQCDLPMISFLAIKGPTNNIRNSSLILETKDLSQELINKQMLEGIDKDWESVDS